MSLFGGALRFLFGMILCVVVSLAIVLYIPHALYAADPCYTIGGAQAVPNGYGVPYNLFSGKNETTIYAHCGTSSTSIVVGSGLSNQYIYEYGYEYKNGAWQRISLSGSNRTGSWFVGSAHALLAKSAAEMGNNNYVLAYICQYEDSTWKCGCSDSACVAPHWQLQQFTKPTVGSPVVIDRIEPEIIHDGDTVTVYGSGFDKTNNTVKTSYGLVTGVPSPDGISLSFVFESGLSTFSVSELDIDLDAPEEPVAGETEYPRETFAQEQQGTMTQEVPLSIHITNAAGASGEIDTSFTYTPIRN